MRTLMKVIAATGGLIIVIIALVIFSSVEPSPSAPSAQGSPAYARPKLTPAELPRARRAYAALLDDKLLDAGFESRTEADGPAHTNLTITCALAGRVMAKQISDHADWATLRALGFKKVVLTDGLDDDGVGFVWNVVPPPHGQHPARDARPRIEKRNEKAARDAQ